MAKKPKLKNPLLVTIIRVIQGILIGAGAILPGVSGGCSGSGAETAIQTTYPSDNVVLKVKSTLETLEYDPTDGYVTFTIHIVTAHFSLKL